MKVSKIMCICGPCERLFEIQNKFLTLPSVQTGLLAEWLGGGLQNRIRRFKSARDLNKIPTRDKG
jgi:hypothetical protein